MIKVYNNIFPLPAFKAMTIWPFMFIRKKAVQCGLFNEVDERHEEIHGEQQREMLSVGVLVLMGLGVLGCGWWSLLGLPAFFYWYGIEWAVKAVIYRNTKTAYKNISFEREAYDHQREIDYMCHREPFAWFKYIR